jgi:hypothetical protein
MGWNWIDFLTSGLPQQETLVNRNTMKLLQKSPTVVLPVSERSPGAPGNDHVVATYWNYLTIAVDTVGKRKER